MSLLIRPSTPDDVPTLVDISNAIDPQNRISVATFEARERSRRPDLFFERVVLEQDGDLIGFGGYGQTEWFANPHMLIVGVQVRPECQGQGHGRRLYEYLLGEAARQQPQRLMAFTASDRPRATRFLEARGWRVIAQERPCAVQLAGADLSGLDAALAHLQAQGYQVRTFAELEGDPEREAKYYALDVDADRDVPTPEGERLQTPTLERYWERVRANPHFDPALWFVAVREGEYGALTQLYRSDTPGVLRTGFTGTARAHRRRGLALALKLTALARARELGAHEVRSENDATNAPMIAINDRLGFRELPAQLVYALEVEEGKSPGEELG